MSVISKFASSVALTTAVAASALITLQVADANATIFDWSFSAPGTTGNPVSGSGYLDATFLGTFTGTDTATASEYLVNQIYGTVTVGTNSSAIAGIAAPGSFGCNIDYCPSPGSSPPTITETNDNDIYYPNFPNENGTFVDGNGLSFVLLNGDEINLSAYESDALVNYSVPGVGAGANDAPFTSLTPAPLPAALPLFAAGLGALSLLGWRRKRKSAAALTAA
jgi:hypothetical protein